MRLILVRHAEAAPGDPDELRPLTAAGHEAARALGERLAGANVDIILTSPLLRARETGADLGFGEPEPLEELSPGATAEDLKAATAGRGETVVVVGHQPDCSEIVQELTGRKVPFAPGAVFEVDL